MEADSNYRKIRLSVSLPVTVTLVVVRKKDANDCEPWEVHDVYGVDVDTPSPAVLGEALTEEDCAELDKLAAKAPAWDS